MAYPSADLSEEAIVHSLLGVTLPEAEAMQQQADQMLAEIRLLHERTQTANEDTRRISGETKAILQRLKADLKLN